MSDSSLTSFEKCGWQCCMCQALFWAKISDLSMVKFCLSQGISKCIREGWQYLTLTVMLVKKSASGPGVIA